MIQDHEIEAAAAALRAGQLVGMPTETVYGLAVDATNPLAVARVFEAKQRPRFNPLISHVASLSAAQEQGAFSPLANRLAEVFWPGPLTLVVPKLAAASACDLACAGLPTIALRIPAHPVAQDLLTAFGRPIAAPSANVSGRPSPTTAQHVRAEFGPEIALILDGGPCQIGLESSVVSVLGDRATLLRLGGLDREIIERIAGVLGHPSHNAHAAPSSPGMLLRHYAPRAMVMLDQTKAVDNSVLIGFGDVEGDNGFNLSPSGDLREAAAQLFAMLRAADALGPANIGVAPIPNIGLGEAINDRLLRAVRR